MIATSVKALLGRIPAPYRTVAACVLVLAVAAALTAAFSQVHSCGYDRSRAEYQSERDGWQQERNRLLGQAEQKERQAAELEVQVQAYKAAAEKAKQVDAALVQKIEQVAKEAADEEARANTPVDCRVRAERVCNLFRSDNPRYDCAAIYGQCDRR